MFVVVKKITHSKSLFCWAVTTVWERIHMALKYGQYFSHRYSLLLLSQHDKIGTSVPECSVMFRCSGVPVFHCSNYTRMKIDTHLSVIEFHWFPTSINWMLLINIDYYWIIDWFSLIDIVRIYVHKIILTKNVMPIPKSHTCTQRISISIFQKRPLTYILIMSSHRFSKQRALLFV